MKSFTQFAILTALLVLAAATAALALQLYRSQQIEVTLLESQLQSLQARVAQLEQQRDRERRDRPLARQTGPAHLPYEEPPVVGVQVQGSQAADRSQPASESFSAADASRSVARLEQLTAAGFSAYDAEVIMQREANAREQLAQILEAPRREARNGAYNLMHEFGASVREDFGEYAYENYLQANALPTAVRVRSVSASSVGESIGLRPGDEIVRYAGERVFDVYQFNQLTGTGSPGEMVSMEVRRAGQLMYMTVPRGTVGFSALPVSPTQYFGVNAGAR